MLTISAGFVLMMTATYAQLPIPSKPDGYTYADGALAASVQIDVFEDTMCPYCKLAAPTLHEVADFYGSDQVRLNTHVFPVPFHNMAWECASAVQVAYIFGGDDAAYEAIDAIFANQTYIETIDSKTDAVKFLTQALQDTLEGFTAGDWGESYEAAEDAALTSWKVSAFRGTDYLPKFMINGVEVVMSASATVEDWTKLINTVLGISDDDDDGTNATCPDDQTYCEYAPAIGYCCPAGDMCVVNVGCRC